MTEDTRKDGLAVVEYFACVLSFVNVLQMLTQLKLMYLSTP